jgi:hypothetical protein
MFGRARRLRHLPLVASLLAVPVLLPASASAADATMGQDEVTLKDGGTIRGTVVSSRPGVSVKIIELGQTETRTIPWAQVGDVERGKYAPAKASKNGKSDKAGATKPGSAGTGYAEAVPATEVTVPAETPSNAVRLHVESPQPALVYSHQTAYGAVNGYGFVVDAATPVCSSPCDKVLDSMNGQTYTAGGDFVPSSPFSLAGTRGDMELSVKPGSKRLRTAGFWLTYSGLILTVVGGSLALTGALISSDTTTNADGTTSGSSMGWLTPTGAAVGIGGVAMLVGGIVAIVSSKTKIDLHPMGATVGGTVGAATAPRYWMGEF